MPRFSAILRFLLMSLLSVAFMGGPALAQTTGTIKGVTVDEGGAAIPGVVVGLSGTSLIGGSQQQATDENGRFLFSSLPPGTYALRADFPGFVPVERPGIEVFIGRTQTVTLELRPSTGDVGATVDVVDAEPTLDVERTSKGEVLSDDFLSRIPGNRSYQSAVSSAPGVIGGGNPNVGGAAYNENTYMLDGVNVTDPVTGTFSLNFNFDAIEQIEVLTGAYDPEYGTSLGGVVNIVTESGSNTLEFDTRFWYSNGDWATDFDSRFTADGAEIAPTGFDTVSSYYEVSVLVSGPVVQDKAWLVFSYTNQRSLRSNAGIDLPRDYEGHYLLAKLTTQPTAAHRLTFLFTADPTSIDNTSQTDRFVDPSAQFRQAQGSVTANVQWDWFFSPEVFVKSSATFRKQFLEISGVPCTHDRELGYNPCEPDELENSLDYVTPGRLGVNLAFDRDNAYFFQFDDRYRISASSKVSVLQRELAGYHDLKAGVEYELQLWRWIVGYTGNLAFVDVNLIGSDPNTLTGYYWLETTSPFDNRQRGWHLGTFIQDVYKPVDNLTFRYGLRWDKSRQLTNTGNAVVDANAFGPRFYIAYDPWGDEKTVLRGGYGRFNDLGTLGLAQELSNSGFGVKYYWGEIINETYSQASNQALYAPLTNTSYVHDNLTAPHSDEFNLGASREVIQDLVASVDFTAKFTTNIYVFDETNWIWDEDGYNIVGTQFGDTQQVFRLRTPVTSRRNYTQTDVQLQKNFADRWQVLATYSYVTSKGTVQTGASAGLGSQAAYLAIPPQYEFAFGNLPTDVRNQVKAAGSWETPFDPWTTSIGGQVQYYSGYPVTRYYWLEAYNGYGVLREEFGTYYRTEPRFYLDVIVQQAIHVRRGQMVVIGQLRNAINAQQAEAATTAVVDVNRNYIFARQAPLEVALSLEYKY